MGEDVQFGRFGAAVVRRDPAEDVLLIRLGVLHDDVEITTGREGFAERVHQLEFGLAAGPSTVLGEQSLVGVLHLRVLVKHPHVGVGGQAVEVVVILLDVLAVVALLVGQAEESLLEERVAAVPDGQRQAEVLEAVAEAGESVLVPSIGAAPGLVVGEVIPGVAVGAIVLAHGPPGSLGEVRPPALPVGATGRAVDQAAVFGGRRVGQRQVSLSVARRPRPLSGCSLLTWLSS